jgi:ankyrin repeat protein
LLDRVRNYFEGGPARNPDEITSGLWNACHGGQLETAQYILGLGANLNWIGYDKKTPLAAAQANGNERLVAWLRSRGAKLADEVRG